VLVVLCCVCLQAASQEDVAAAEKLPYKVVVCTSDIKFAGTDANVFVEICGERCVHCLQYVRQRCQ
jgi:hypothetical protein